MPSTTALSYAKEGNDVCFAIEDQSFWFRHRNECIRRMVERFADPAAGVFLDVGGGNGFVARDLRDAGYDTVMIEPSLTGAANARRRNLEQVVCATVGDAVLKPRSVANVGLFDVIEHIEDDVEFLKSIRPVLKPGGGVFITVPAYQMLWSVDDDLV